MGDIKVKSLKEKNLADKVTSKWRETVKEIVHQKNNTINITKMENDLVDLPECDWVFNLRFLVLFFSIFGLGNKDGTLNERIIPFLPNTDEVSKMDWCSYTLESMVRGCKELKVRKYFSGPLLLMAIIYVNSTVSETVKVNKIVPAFLAWISKLSLKREQEEFKLGCFGRLPIVDGLQMIERKNKKTYKKKNLIEKEELSITGKSDKQQEVETTEDAYEEVVSKKGEEVVSVKKTSNRKKICASKRKIRPEIIEDADEEVVTKKVKEVVRGKKLQVHQKGRLRLKQLKMLMKMKRRESEQVDGKSDEQQEQQVEVEKVKALKEKRTVKRFSNFYQRRINIFEPFSEEEKKLVEYIWNDSCNISEF